MSSLLGAYDVGAMEKPQVLAKELETPQGKKKIHQTFVDKEAKSTMDPNPCHTKDVVPQDQSPQNTNDSLGVESQQTLIEKEVGSNLEPELHRPGVGGFLGMGISKTLMALWD